MTVLQVLCDSIRLTDIIGWQEEHRIPGVILTEFGNCERVLAIERIKSKILTSLKHAIPTSLRSDPRISVQFFPDHHSARNGKGELDLTFYPELDREAGTKSARDVFKRSLDLLGSGLALTMLSPLLAAIAAAVRLTSKGPALYRQERIGQFGVAFVMYKFRSMRTNCDPGIHQQYVKQFISGKAKAEENSGIYKLVRDPRITPLGRFLRKTSLDELPQLLNVLRGQMSLVGPRPPLRYELEAYEPWHRRRLLEAKPGLTGLWQVTGRSRTRFDDMVRLDLRYAEKRSLFLDFVLLVKTIRVLIDDEGAC